MKGTTAVGRNGKPLFKKYNRTLQERRRSRIQPVPRARRRSRIQPVPRPSPSVRPQTTEFYSKKLNTVLYHITKCAMTTMRNFLGCDRVPSNSIPASAVVVCVVRDPVDRFVSGFLTLRKIGLLDMYRVRSPSSRFTSDFKRLPLLPAFLRTVEEVQRIGPFDTHLQAQQNFLGPSNTVQNEFAGNRRPEKVNHWIDIKNLDAFCLATYGKKPPRANTANPQSKRTIQEHLRTHPSVAVTIQQLFRQDGERHRKVSGG